MCVLAGVNVFFWSAGGTGCVLMVYGLNAEKMNCDKIFNLFCLYGNVVKVNILNYKIISSSLRLGSFCCERCCNTEVCMTSY